MQKLLMVGILALAGLLAMGAGQVLVSPEEHAHLSAEARLRKGMAPYLIEPWNAKFEALTIFRNGNICGMVNSKSPFGGYAGPQRFAWEAKTGSGVVYRGGLASDWADFKRRREEICAD